MASNYQVSPLDSNKSILMVLKDIQKYLKDNPIYKVYFCNTNFVPDTLVYNLSDIDTDGLLLSEEEYIKMCRCRAFRVQMTKRAKRRTPGAFWCPTAAN